MTNQSPPPSASAAKLSTVGKFKLMEFLRGIHGDGSLAKLTLKEATAQAAKNLKCYVPMGTVSDACTALGFEWKKVRGAKKANLETRVAALESQVAKIAASVDEVLAVVTSPAK